MSAPIHVGVDATTWWNDRGFGRFTRELVSKLIARGQAGASPFRYTLVIDREPASALPAGADVLARATSRSLMQAAVGDGARSPADMFALSRLVASQRFDLFFFPAVYSFFPLARPVPCVVAFHDTIAERFPKLGFPTLRNRLFWRAKVAIAKAQADRIMTVSRASARDLVDILGVKPGDIDVVTEAADPAFRRLADPAVGLAARARYGVPPGAPLFVYVGGLSPHKNLLMLLKGLPLVLASRPDAHLLIVGDTSGKGFHDNRAELEAMVQQNPLLTPRVQFTGYVPDAELVALYNAATALVFPSLWEGFGLPAVEAMACGLPVLASDRGSLPEVVGDGGLLFDPEAASQIADAMLRILADEPLRVALGERALRRAAGFTWDDGAALSEDCFRRCIAVRGGR